MAEAVLDGGARTGKLFLDVLERHVTERLPFWFMRQAGRYLPEYQELRASKDGFMNMVFDPVAACEATMQPIRRFGMDAAIIFSDILVVPYALGQRVEFVEGEGPKLEPLRSAADFSRLGYRDFQGRLKPVYEALARTRQVLKTENFNETALIGFAGAPWTVACYMIEGGSSRDFMNIKKMAYAEPELLGKLVNLLIESTAVYLTKQVEAGAEALQIFDSWAGVLDERLFKRWVTEPTKQVVQLVRDAYPHVPIIGFPRGAGRNCLTYIQETKVGAIGIDPQMSTKWAAQTLQPVVPVQGNMDPVCLMAGGDAMITALEGIVNDLRKGPFVFNLGHGIHKDTPVENVWALCQRLKEMKAA